MKDTKTVTCTNGNSVNGISGSRITIKDINGNVIDKIDVTRRNGIKYCEEYPNGIYGKRYFSALNK